jgi:hypothetical protein
VTPIQSLPETGNMPASFAKASYANVLCQLELVPGVSLLSGGYFEHREWAIRRGMERNPILRPLLEYEDRYTNSSGCLMSFSSAAMALRGEALKLEVTTRVEKVQIFDVWAMMAERYGLRVVELRVEFYKRSAKDTMHARLVMPVLEGQNDTPDDLDEAMQRLDMHMAIQLMKDVSCSAAWINLVVVVMSTITAVCY